ncbi:MAG: ATP-grasp domain-containing protein [Clostridia bacterium]|nr:ATP-grasp domain-containing protein [Clostridia bacterium]
MDKLVIIGANDFQNQLILRAKALGYETHVFAWEQGAAGKETADRFYPISIIEKDEILGKCREITPVGVCSIASDLAAVTVNYVAEALGLPCNKTKYVPIQTNKYLMRSALTEAGIPCPRFVLAGDDFELSMIEGFSFPVIVKPTDRSGSRCVTKVGSAEEILPAVRSAAAVSFEKRAVVEEFIPGDEYSMETVTQNGSHHYLATTKKYTTGAPNFIETGHRQPSGLSKEILQKAYGRIVGALDALHVENSAAHSEFKVDNNGDAHIIEIGARMGGDCIGSDLVYLSTGHDFMKMVIDIAVGNPIKLNPSPTENTVSVKFLFTPEDIDKMYAFRDAHPERIVRISQLELENLGRTTDSASRVGYYIFR